MDSLTHAFTGILCAQAVRRERPGGLALGAAVVAASAADLDWWTVSMSMTAYLERHRGVAHAIAAIPFVAVAVAACFHGLGRVIARRRGVPAERFWSLLPLCLLAATTHPLLDSLNPYGLRPFLPFDGTWYYGDIAAVLDPWVWLMLGGATALLSGRGLRATRVWVLVGSVIVFGSLRAIPARGAFGVTAGLVWVAAASIVLGLWLRDVGLRARRVVALTGLGLTAIYIAALAVVHQRAEAKAVATARTLADATAERVGRVAAIPTVGDLSTWRGLAETDRSIYRFPVWLGAGPGVPVERFATLAATRNGAVADLRAEPSTRAFLSFARFVAVAEETEDGRRMLLLADPRFDSARPGEPSTWPIRRPRDG